MAPVAKSELQKIDLLALAGVTEIAVASTGAAYSHAFQPRRNSAMSLELKFSSSGAVDVKTEIQHGGGEPATEGAASTDFVTADAVAALSAGITDQNVHFIAMSPVVAPYLRLKFTGQGSNAASTKIVRAILRIADNA